METTTYPGIGSRARFANAAACTVLAICALALTACASGGAGGPGREVIRPTNAQTLATYSPAIRIGNLVFFSGQIGLRPGGEGLAGNIREETRQALENLRNLMNAAGVERDGLVKCTVFLADIRDYAAMNEVYAAFFQPEPAPARSAVGVAGLPAGARVEIECIAAVGD